MGGGSESPLPSHLYSPFPKKKTHLSRGRKEERIGGSESSDARKGISQWEAVSRAKNRGIGRHELDRARGKICRDAGVGGLSHLTTLTALPTLPKLTTLRTLATLTTLTTFTKLTKLTTLTPDPTHDTHHTHHTHHTTRPTLTTLATLTTLPTLTTLTTLTTLANPELGRA